MSIAAFVAIYFVHLAAAISPGPAVLMAARTSLRDGLKRGAWLSVGIGLGACIWAVAALFGLALLFKIAPALLVGFKVFGAGYLLYLAYKMWKHAPDPINTAPNHTVTMQHGRLPLIWLGIVTQQANPKATVFFGTVFLTFVPPQAPLWAYGIILCIVFFNEAGWNVVVSRIFSLQRTRQVYLNLKTMVDRLFGGVLAALGVKLALT